MRYRCHDFKIQIKWLAIAGLFIFPVQIKSQISVPSNLDFVKFVGKNFKIPQSLKYSCNWNYAVVRMDLDKNYAVCRYECLNKASDTIKQSLKFLIGYSFSNTIHNNGHPVVFYITVDNLYNCKPQPGDVTYTPNQVVQIIASILFKIKQDDPQTLIIPELITASWKPPVK